MPGAADSILVAYRTSRPRSPSIGNRAEGRGGSEVARRQRSAMRPGSARLADSMSRAKSALSGSAAAARASAASCVAPSGKSLLIEIVEMLRQLVDDFRLSRDGQRRQAVAHELSKVHRNHPIGSILATRLSAVSNSCQLLR